MYVRYASAALAAFALVAVWPGHAHASAILVANYAFQGSYDDSLNISPALTPDGGSLGAGVYNFGAKEGLSLGGALAGNTGNYTIGMRFQFSSLATKEPGAEGTPDGWRRILDFHNLQTDYGLYVEGPTLIFYASTPPGKLGEGGQGGTLTAGQYADLVISRDGSSNLVNVYLNNQLKFDFTDLGNNAVFDTANQMIHFFEDNTVENGAGSTQHILLYAGAASTGEIASIGSLLDDPPAPSAVPEPTSLALAGIGLGSIVAFRRLRRRLAA